MLRLQALVASLTTKIKELENNPRTVTVADDATLNELRADLAGIRGKLAGKDQALTAAEGRSADLERQLMALQGQLDTERLIADQRAADEKDHADREAELQRRREEAEAVRQAQIHSDMVAWRAGGGADTSETAGEAQERFIGADDFLRASARPVKTKLASLIANPAHTIMQGTLIEAALEVAISSDLPGTVSAVVTSDVWSFDMSRVLIPRGSKLFGRYASDVGLGQKRILIAWTRIVTTDGQSVEIASYGSGGLGRSGLPARVRSHFLAKFGSAALLSIIGAAPDYAAAEASNDTATDVIRSVGTDLESATDAAIGDYLAIPPTLSTDQGAIVMIRVDSDLELF